METLQWVHNLFAQLYVIIAGFGESALPACCKEKPKPHTNICRRSCKKKVAERLEMYLYPNKFILDYEIAAINAIGAVLGNGALL